MLLCSSGIPSSLGISGETGHTVILYGVAIFLGFSAVLQSNLSSCARTFPEAPRRLPYTDGPAGTTPRYQAGESPSLQSSTHPFHQLATIFQLPSAGRITLLAAIFSVDAFGGGMTMNSLLVCTLLSTTFAQNLN